MVPLRTTTHSGAISQRASGCRAWIHSGPAFKGRHKGAVPIVPSSSFRWLSWSFLRSRRVAYPPPPFCSKNTVLEQAAYAPTAPILRFPISKTTAPHQVAPPKMCLARAYPLSCFSTEQLRKPLWKLCCLGSRHLSTTSFLPFQGKWSPPLTKADRAILQPATCSSRSH